MEAHDRTHRHDELEWVFVDPNRGLVFLHHDCLLSWSTRILENRNRGQDRNSAKCASLDINRLLDQNSGILWNNLNNIDLLRSVKESKEIIMVSLIK